MNASVSANASPTFGALLQRFRLSRGLTQEALADRAQISPRAISDLERDVRRYPRRETQRLLSAALGLSEIEHAQLSAAAVRPSRPTHRTRTTSGSSDTVVTRFAQRSGFVGRQHELNIFEERLAAAGARHGGVLLIYGEPGIGKSRFLAETIQRARGTGWQVLTGRSYDMDAMPPYLPFAEVLRNHFAAASDDSSFDRLVTDAPEIAGLLPEVRGRVAAASSRPSLGPEADRYRLFEAVSNTLETLSESPTHRGLMICLDDLHWADASTLLLLEHVARRLAGAPFLLVASYRDEEVNTETKLADTLERLVRERLSQSLEIPPLTSREVALMLTELGGSAPPDELAETICSETEGNALFVEEMFEFLLQQGLLIDEQGEWSGGLSLASIGIPQGIRLVIEGRLRQLSEDCRRTLLTGSAIGRTFEPELLQKVAELEEEVFFDALEEAQRFHLLASNPETAELSFSHELIRQTLLNELSLPRKQRLHEKTALALEELHAADVEHHLAELATHYRLANAPAALQRAINFGVRAGDQASAVFAYREAAHLYEQALEALDLVDPDNPERRCDLLLALGRVLLPEGDASRVLESVAPQALSIAKSIDDMTRARLACRLAMEALSRRGMRMSTLTIEWEKWASEYERFAGLDTVDRVRLSIDAAELRHMTGREAEARQMRLDALHLARRLEQPDELLYATSFCMHYTTAPRYQRERLKLAEEATGMGVEGVSARTLAFFYLYTGWAFWDWGRRTEAETAWKKLHSLPDVSPDNFATFFSFFADGCAGAIEGRLEDVVPLALQASPTGDRLGSPVVGRMSSALIAYRPLIHLGRAPEAAHLMELAWRELGVTEEPAYFKPRRLLAMAHFESGQQARDLLEEIMTERSMGPENDGNVATADLLPLLEASILLEEPEAAAILCRRLDSVAGMIESHVGTNTSVGRHLGDAALLFGRFDEARSYYDQALATCERIGFRPEAALTRMSLGSLLLNQYPEERFAATEHLEFAQREFREMKMGPALEQALRIGQ
jgi:transcriptional regulator with XRE-family HTH domain/tetratricopeptide (TPR) repeat protein